MKDLTPNQPIDFDCPECDDDHATERKNWEGNRWIDHVSPRWVWASLWFLIGFIATGPVGEMKDILIRWID